MDIIKYPLTGLSADALLNRLSEECAEVIHAIAKRARFGEDELHPRTGETANERITAEIDDTLTILEELMHRLALTGTFNPVGVAQGVTVEDWMGGAA